MARNNDILVLTVNEHGAGLVRVRREGDRVRLDGEVTAAVQEAKRDTLALTNDLVVSKLVAHVHQQSWRGREVCVAIGGAQVTTQSFDMPAIKPSALRGAVELKLAQQLVYDVREATLWMDTPLTAPNSANCSVDTVAVPTAQTKLCMDICTRLGLRATRITSATTALAEVARQACGLAGEGLEAVLHIAERGSTLIVFRDGRVIVNTELAPGVSDLAAALMRPIIKGDDIVQLDPAGARKLLDEVGLPAPGQEIASLGVSAERILPVIEPVIQQFTRQLMQWMSFVRTSNDGRTFQSLCVIGPGGRLANLAAIIGQRLQLPARAADWSALLDGAPAEEIDAAVAFGPAIGVALAKSALPDLRPAEMRRRQMVGRFRRIFVLAGPAAAIGLSVIAVLLRQVAGGVSAAQAAQATVVSRTAEELARWVQWQSAAAKTKSLDKSVADFQRATPRWQALFKELSNVLPPSMQITTLAARTHDGRLRLRMAARMHDIGEPVDFDRLVEQTLGVLQTSPFFERVEVLSATRSSAQGKDDRTIGNLVLDLSMCYPAEPKPPKPATPEAGR